MTEIERDAGFLEALESCRERVRAGEALAACLEEYPQAYREALEELVPLTMRVESAALEPSPEFLGRLESDLLGAVDRERAARRSGRRAGGLLRGTLVRALAGAVLGVVLVTGTGFLAVEASADALPGEPLYRVKEFREAVELWLARSDAAELEAYETRLARRGGELDRAIRAGEGSDVLVSVERGIARSVREVVDRALRLQAAGNARAADRALEAIRTAEGRALRLAASATTREELVTIRRVLAFLETQEQRLLAPAAPSGR